MVASRAKLVFCAGVIGFFIFLVFRPSPIQADLGKGPVQKFGRGIVYIVSSPFHFPKEMIQAAAEAEPVYWAPWKGFSVGLGNGLFHFGRQMVSGFYDLLTCWTPGGRDWAPLFEPASLFPEI